MNQMRIETKPKSKPAKQPPSPSPAQLTIAKLNVAFIELHARHTRPNSQMPANLSLPVRVRGCVGVYLFVYLGAKQKRIEIEPEQVYKIGFEHVANIHITLAYKKSIL